MAAGISTQKIFDQSDGVGRVNDLSGFVGISEKEITWSHTLSETFSQPTSPGVYDKSGRQFVARPDWGGQTLPRTQKAKNISVNYY
jgi:hypothetical protein